MAKKSAWLNPRKKKQRKMSVRVTKDGVQIVKSHLADYPDKLKPIDPKKERQKKEEELDPTKQKKAEELDPNLKKKTEEADPTKLKEEEKLNPNPKTKEEQLKDAKKEAACRLGA